MSEVIAPAATAATTAPVGVTPTNPNPQTPAATAATTGDSFVSKTELDSANKHIKTLNDENKKYRLLQNTCETLGIEPDKLKAHLDAVNALGIPLDKLKTIVDEHKVLSENVAKTSKTEALKKAAGVAGINADLLASLDGALGVEYTTVGEGDKATATVKYKDANGVEVVKPLSDWAKEKWPALETALTTVGESGQQQQQRITKLGKGPSANTGGQTQTVWDRIREEKKAKQEAANTGRSWEQQYGLEP